MNRELPTTLTDATDESPDVEEASFFSDLADFAAEDDDNGGMPEPSAEPAGETPPADASADQNTPPVETPADPNASADPVSPDAASQEPPVDATATPAEPTPEAPPAVPDPAAANQTQNAPQQTQPEQSEPVSTQQVTQEQLEQWQTQTAERLATTTYALTPEQTQEIGPELGATLSQMASRIHVHLQMEGARMAVEAVQRMMPTAMSAYEAQRQTESQFFDAYPALASHRNAVQAATEAWQNLPPHLKQANPHQQIATMAAGFVGVDLTPPAAAPTPQPAPAPAPVPGSAQQLPAAREVLPTGASPAADSTQNVFTMLAMAEDI